MYQISSPLLPSPASMSTTTPTRLPPELTDMIIDELKDDTPSLRECSLVSKEWADRSRKHLFKSVVLGPKWFEHIQISLGSHLSPHNYVKSLSISPNSTPSAPFCLPETSLDHLQSFTRVLELTIDGSCSREWTVAFSDSHLVKKYFGGFGHSLQKLTLSEVHLNMVTLKALLDVFPNLVQLWIEDCTMVDEGTEDVEAFQERVPVRSVDEIVVISSPQGVLDCLTNIPLRCRGLELMHGRGLVFTLNNFPTLREFRIHTMTMGSGGTTDPIRDQVRLIDSITSTSLEKILFGGLLGYLVKHLKPLELEAVDRALCRLMDRLDDGVTLEVSFLKGSMWHPSFKSAELLNGVRKRGGIVKFLTATHSYFVTATLPT